MIITSYGWQAWLEGDGLTLPVHMEYDITLAKAAYSLADMWHQSRETSVSHLTFKETDLQNFNSNQKSEIVFRRIAVGG